MQVFFKKSLGGFTNGCEYVTIKENLKKSRRNTNMTAFEYAKQQYARYGIDVEKAMEKLKIGRAHV